MRPVGEKNVLLAPDAMVALVETEQGARGNTLSYTRFLEFLESILAYAAGGLAVFMDMPEIGSGSRSGGFVFNTWKE